MLLRFAGKFGECLETPVSPAGDVVCDLQEEALRQLSALQAVLHTEIAAFVMVVGIKGTGEVRTGTKR
jgi:hypothetical protein